MLKAKSLSVFAAAALLFGTITPGAFAASSGIVGGVSIVTTPVTSLVQSILGGSSVSTNTSSSVTSTNGNTSVDLSNQASASLAGNSIQSSAGLVAQLGL